MGVAISTSVADSIQTVTNTTYQSARNECGAECNQIQSGNVVVISGSTAGDITFTQRCTGEASCYMKNAIEQAVDVFQSSEVDAAAAPALFPGIQVNTSVSSNRQDITNELTQIMENLCTANVNQVSEGNMVFATDSTLGNIGFLQEGDASAKCVMDNAARLQLQMRQDGTTTARTGAAASIIGAIIGVVIVVVIIIVVLRAMSSGKKLQGDSKSIAAKQSSNFGAESSKSATGGVSSLQSALGRASARR